MSTEKGYILTEILDEIRTASNPQVTALKAVAEHEDLEEAELLDALKVKSWSEIPTTPYPALLPAPDKTPAPGPARKKRGPRAGQKKAAPSVPKIPAEAEAENEAARLRDQIDKQEQLRRWNHQNAQDDLETMQKGLEGLELFFKAFFVEALDEEEVCWLDCIKAKTEGFKKGYECAIKSYLEKPL